MPSKLPTTTVQLLDGDTATVTFGIGRLVAIETAMGKTANAVLLDDLATLAPFDPDQDKDSDRGGADGNDAKAAEHYQAAARKIGAGYMARFVAACLDKTVGEVDAALGPSELRPAFIALAGGFIEAVGLLNGAGEPPEADPPKPAAAG